MAEATTGNNLSGLSQNTGISKSYFYVNFKRKKNNF